MLHKWIWSKINLNYLKKKRLQMNIAHVKFAREKMRKLIKCKRNKISFEEKNNFKENH